MPKADDIQFLVTNCACLKGQDAALNGMSDEAVEGVRTYVEALGEAGEVVTAIRNAIGADDEATTNQLPELVVNAMKGGKKCGPDDDDDDDTEMSTNAWLARMPSGFKPTWNSFLGWQKDSKKQAIDTLVSNRGGTPDEQKALRTKLEKRSAEDLQDMLDLLPKKPTRNTANDDSDDDGLGDFLGAAGGRIGSFLPTANADDGELIDLDMSIPADAVN